MNDNNIEIDETDNGFSKAARPLMEWLGKNCHPHMKVIVESDCAELVEGQRCYRTSEYISD